MRFFKFLVEVYKNVLVGLFKFLVEVYKNVLVGLAVVLVALVATVCVSLTGFMLGVIYEENVKLALLIGFGFLFGLGYCIRKWGWK